MAMVPSYGNRSPVLAQFEGDEDVRRPAPLPELKLPPPDAGYIGDLIRSARDEFSERETRDRLREQLYWQENLIAHPAHVEFEAVHMGIATETIERVAGILDDYPVIQVGSAEINTDRRKKAARMKDFGNMLWPALEDDSDTDTWAHTLRDVITYGRGNDQLLYVPGWRSKSAPGYPTREPDEDPKRYGGRVSDWHKTARLPMVWRHLPVRGTFLWRDDLGVSEALVVEFRRVRDVLGRYDLPALRKQVNDKQVSLLSYVYLAQYYSRDYFATWVSTGAVPSGADAERGRPSGVDSLGADVGEIAQVHHNYYGCVPITETSGITTSMLSSGKRQISVIDHLLPLCVYLDRLVSQRASSVRMWAWPTPYLRNLGVNGQMFGQPNTDKSGRPVSFEIEPGKLVTLLPGEDFGWLVAPQDAGGADALIGTIQRQADLLGISSAVFNGDALSSNGYLFNSVLNAVRSKYSPIVRHVKRTHRHRCQLAYKIVELHGEPLQVFRPDGEDEFAGEWLELKPDDVAGNWYQIQVNFEDKLPSDEAADLQMALQSTSGRLMTRKQAMAKYLHDANPDKTEQLLLVQDFEESEPVRQFLMAKAVEEAGYQLEQQEVGTPQGVFGGMSPEQLMALPPALLQAAGLPAQAMAPMGSPSAMGGVPGAPAQPYMPGLNAPLTPPPPNKPRMQGGRRAGQSRRPGRPTPLKGA